MPETLQWYRHIGFHVRGDPPDPAAAWVEIGCENLVLQLRSGETPWEGDPVFTGSFYVHTPSVDRVYVAVKDKVAVEWGVEERPWGSRELTLADPNGYFITFTELTSAPSADAPVWPEDQPA